MLGLIVPGTLAQVFAGLALTFIYMLVYQATMPYTDKLLRRISYAMAVQLFLFFLFALMARARAPSRGQPGWRRLALPPRRAAPASRAARAAEGWPADHGP